MKKRQKNRKFVLLVEVNSKAKSIEKIISKALIDAENSHEDLTLVSNVEKSYRKLKEMIRIMRKVLEVT